MEAQQVKQMGEGAHELSVMQRPTSKCGLGGAVPVLSTRDSITPLAHLVGSPC